MSESTPNGFFHYHTAPASVLRLIAGLTHSDDGRGKEGGGQGEVVQPVGRSARRFDLSQSSLQLGEAGGRGDVSVTAMDPAGKILPYFGGGREMSLLAETLIEAGVKFLLGHFAAGHPDYLDFRAEPSLAVKVGQGGGQLVSGEVAGRPEYNNGRSLVCHSAAALGQANCRCAARHGRRTAGAARPGALPPRGRSGGSGNAAGGPP